MPRYQKNDPPQNENGKTNADIEFMGVTTVLEVDEKKNTITIQIMQWIEWEDSRIKANISAMPNMLYCHSWTRFYPDIVQKIFFR